MLVYTAAVIVIVVFSSLILAFITKKNSFFDMRLVLATAVSSIVVSFMFPWIYSMFSSSGILDAVYFAEVLPIAVAVILNIILIFMFTILISTFISEKDTKTLSDGFKDKIIIGLGNTVKSTINKLKESLKKPSVPNNPQEDSSNSIAQPSENGPYTEIDKELEEREAFIESQTEVEDASTQLEQAEENKETEQVREEVPIEIEEFSENDKVKGESKDNLETGGGQPTPTFNKIDIGNDDGSVKEYIDEAFRLKESGDFEGAILNYMHALEKKPRTSLLFWIVIDICTLYKSLGKTELARDILESYAANYEHLMDEAVKLEIERNLSHV